jgi:hypothetical protein
MFRWPREIRTEADDFSSEAAKEIMELAARGWEQRAEELEHRLARNTNQQQAVHSLRARSMPRAVAPSTASVGSMVGIVFAYSCGSTTTVPTLPPASTALCAAAVWYSGKWAATERIRPGEAVQAAMSDWARRRSGWGTPASDIE